MEDGEWGGSLAVATTDHHQALPVVVGRPSVVIRQNKGPIPEGL